MGVFNNLSTFICTYESPRMTHATSFVDKDSIRMGSVIITRNIEEI